jgi:hypothetical protein
MVELTAAHWVYLLFVVAVLVTMFLRRETPLVCMVGAFVLALVITGNLLLSIRSIFEALVVACNELLGTVVLISVIVALAKLLEMTGVAELMIAPLRGALKKPEVSFWILGIGIAAFALFIWPSPAIALIGALLLPAAIATGLPPVAAAMSISLFGYGVALTTDFIIQGAPGITAKAAGIAVGDVISKSLVMVVVWAAIALPLAFRRARAEIAKTKGREIAWAPLRGSAEEEAEREKWSQATPFKRFAAAAIPAVLALDAIIMLVTKLRGGDATALLGGTVALIMVVLAVVVYREEGMEKFTDHMRAGFIFGVRIFAPVFLIAAFFFMGAPGAAKAIFGPEAKGLLFDLGQALANAVPLSRVPVAAVQAVVGGITGLDGSGFSGLPLVGTLAGALGPSTGLNVGTLAALGQFLAVGVGGGTIVPWALIPAAAISGVDPVEIARANFMPAMAGFLGVLIVAIFLL